MSAPTTEAEELADALPAELTQNVATETGDGLVQVAYLHEHMVSHSFMECMTRQWLWDMGHAQRIVRTAGPLMIRAYTGGIADGRNFATKHFLDETPHEWLWFIDTDMGFLPDCVETLVQGADAIERPVVGALCFALREMRGDGYGGRRVAAIPTLYQIGTQDDGLTGFTPRFDFPMDSLVQVAGTGAACLLIHRSVLVEMREKHGEEWFSHVRYDDGRNVSEDLSFCYRLADLGRPVFVHTGVRTTHHKMCWIGVEDYVRPANAADHDAAMRGGVPLGVKVIEESDEPA